MKVFWILRRRKLGKRLCFAPTADPASVKKGSSCRAFFAKRTDPSRVTKRGYHKLPDTTDEIVRAPVEPDIDSSSYSDYSDCDLDDEDTDSEFDEALTCNVCDRSFASTRLLAQHQQKKRHFGCSVCDSIFPNLMTLEHHKEALDHWSEDEGNTHDSESDGDDSDDEDGGLGSGEKAEEKERLL